MYFVEFERFVNYQEQWRQRLYKSEIEKEQLRQENKDLKYQRGGLEAKLKDTRSQLEQEMRRRALAEKHRDALVSCWKAVPVGRTMFV